MSTMLVLMANLAESPIMQSSPGSGHLLTIPLNEEDQETNAAWKTAESFLDSVKVRVLLRLSLRNESHCLWGEIWPLVKSDGLLVRSQTLGTACAMLLESCTYLNIQ